MSMNINVCYTVVVIFLSLANSTNVGATENDVPIVKMRLGKIQGTKMTSFRGSVFYAFRGIPYAKPPVGVLRFAPPQPISKWDGVFRAIEDSPVCPQPVAGISMSEDCLKINVYTNSFNGSKPVIVYIHGGANVLGSGHSDYEAGPDYLLDYDIVFVSFNYRLGILGFLCMGQDTDFKGNLGYLDQVLALKWIHEHIGSFGGNPKLVTIMGLSAGAMAVTLHLVSPLSMGLFQHAIAMSGSATNHFSIDNVFWTRKVARDASCPMYDADVVVECLRNVTWQHLIKLCELYEPYKVVNMKWNYEIDEHFLHRHPTELLAAGSFNKVPILTGITKNELDFSMSHHVNNTLLLRDISLYFDEYAPEFFLFDYNPQKSSKIKKFYFGKKEIRLDRNLTLLGEIFSDAIIGHGVHRLVEIARKFTNVYYYRMDYVNNKSNSAPISENGLPIGVAHADDIQYVMPGTWYGPKMKYNETHVFMIDRILSWYVRFAKTGIPDIIEHWEPCTVSEKIMLYNDIETSMDDVEKSLLKRYHFWDKLFPAPSKATRAQYTSNRFGTFTAVVVIIASVSPDISSFNL